MCKKLEKEINEYLSKISGNTENQTIAKASKKLDKMLWGFSYSRKLAIGAYIFAVVYAAFWAYMAITSKDMVGAIIGVVGVVFIVLSTIIGRKLDTFFAVKKFKRLKLKIDGEL